MKIRKINERMDETKLSPIEVFALSNLFKTVSKERVEYLISLFNNGSKSIEDHEICLLINYVVKGRLRDVEDDDYGLYVTDSGKKIILSSDEIKNGDYTIDTSINVSPIGIDRSEYISEPFAKYAFILSMMDCYSQLLSIDPSKNASTIIPDLEKLGFKFLETKDSLLAFCAARNIVLWAPSIEEFNKYYKTDKYSYFQQSRVAYNGEKVVSMYSNVDDCEEDKTDFPLFKDRTASYLWLYDIRKEKGAFSSSMKRIAQYPELYHAVGSENQAIIDDIILNELYPKLNEIYYNSDASLNSKKLCMIQIVKEQYGWDNKRVAELLSTKYDFQIRDVDVRKVKSR